MATTFINYTAENIGTTTYHMIDDAATTNNPTGVASLDSGKAQIAIGCMISNILTTSVTVTVSLRNVGVVTRLAKDLPIPAGDAVEIIQGKVVMEAGDEIEISASTANACDAVLSVLKNA